MSRLASVVLFVITCLFVVCLMSPNDRSAFAADDAKTKATSATPSNDKVPSFDEIKAKIRPDHPRLFINKDTLPRFREYAQTVCKTRLKNLKSDIARYGNDIKLEYRLDVVDMVDGRMVFKRPMGDQNAVLYGLKYAGGVRALECAIVYMATGEEAYRDKALKYLQVCVEFIKLAKHSKILPEWYHNERLSAIIAWDWLYDTMTDEQRRDFIVPMLEYIDFMRKPGYQSNGGGFTTGNYGEQGLRWFAGLAAFRTGYADELAEKTLETGYKNYVDTMNYREEIAGARGLLTSITAGYSFGAYPWASYNFLHTLASAASLDGTKIWTQMRDYGDYFFWMAIPNDEAEEKFSDFGWGDTTHQTNSMSIYLMYTHLAQSLHFYGKESPDQARRIGAVMNMLPEKVQHLQGTKFYPHIPFILFNFDPTVKSDMTPSELQGKSLAQHFPSYGLMNVRSGSTPNDTYASFKAGAKQDGHQHYDENTFIIYKNGFQALDTGTRGSAPHHLLYYPQTVAHNGILIRAENEPLARHWYPANAPRIEVMPHADGGQNRHKAAHPLGFQQTAWYAVSGGDATACYDKSKCSEAIRIFLFVKPDYFAVYDRVTSTKPDQQKVFLLHTQNEPKQVKNAWHSTAGKGSLFVRTLLPADSQTQAIGGPDHEFTAGNVNYPMHASADKNLKNSPNWYGRWRLEISPKQSTDKVRFLHLLQAATSDTTEMVRARTLMTTDRDGVEFIDREGNRISVWFNRDGQPGGKIRIRDKQNIKILEEDFSRNLSLNLPLSL
ncbi:MAG: heparinase II/III family protein [Planctomycetia bacterium]|nr:heparinase II/III family protein [Planctomycetia bacterium]